MYGSMFWKRVGEGAFKVAAAKECDSLPKEELREIKSLNSFKNKVFNFFFF